MAEAREDEEREGRAQVIGLARGGALNLAGTVVSQAAGFVVLMAMGWKLGSRAVGLYAQAFAFLALLELLSLSGFRSGLTRYVAVHRADRDDASLRGTLRLGLGLSCVSSVLLGAALFVAAPWLARTAFDDPALQSSLRLVALTLPPTVLMAAALSATQGFLTMRYFAGIGLLLVPGLRLGLTLVLLVTGAGLRGVLVALLIAQTVGAVLGLAALRVLTGSARGRPKPRYQLGEIFSYSMVSWLASLASNGLLWADTILLGLYLPSSDVGRYQIVSRLVLLASLAMAPVNASFAPHIADLYRRGRTESLRRTYAVATGWILRLSLPGFVVVAVFSPELARMFGPGFTVGAAVAVVLVVGKLTDAATGPCGLMLNQSGRVALNMIDNVGVLVLNIGLNLYLIPRHGLIGSAVAWMISLVAVNAARFLQVRATMGMVPFDRSSAKGVVAALAALVAALGLSVVAAGSAAVLIGVPVTLAAYVAALLLLGLSPDDRLLFEELRRRARPDDPAASADLPVLVTAGRS